jgi:hypothetical protein
VLDFDALNKVGWVVQDPNLNVSAFKTTTGLTAIEYTNNMASKVGANASVGYAGVAFSTELTSSFDKNRYTKDAYSFATSSSVISKDAYYLNHYTDPSKLKDYLTKEFIQDLSGLKAADIIAKYGTHVMLGAIWGARLDYNFSAQRTIESLTEGSAYGLEAKVSATVEAFTGSAGANASIQSKFSTYYDETTIQTTTYAQGGKPEYARNVHDKNDYDKWIETVDAYQVWADYYPNSLRPIYEFATGMQQEVLKAEYDKYLQGKQINVGTSLVSKTTNEDFVVRGDKSKVSRGGKDDDVDTEGKKTAYYTLTISLRKSSTGIIADFNYKVEEGGTKSDRTVLTLIDSYPIAVNEKNFEIDKTSWSSGRIGITGEKHSWNSVPTSCSFISGLQVQIDGSGGDTGNIAVKGTFKIPYKTVQ